MKSCLWNWAWTSWDKSFECYSVRGSLWIFCFLGQRAVPGLACASISSLLALRCEEGKASWLPAECRSTRCVFNQEQGWESLLGLDVEVIVSLTPSVARGEDREGNVACKSDVKRSWRVKIYVARIDGATRRNVMGKEDAQSGGGVID